MIAIAAALLVVPTASAAWSPSAIGSGAARAKALGTGNIPTATVSGKKVTVTWSASTFSNGGNVPGLDHIGGFHPDLPLKRQKAL